MLKLTRPLTFFDLETTGLDVKYDRIVQLAVHQIQPNLAGGKFRKWLINPGIAIPQSASEIHGITDEMVKDAPYLMDVIDEILPFFDDCDLGGFNSNIFDIPLLNNEFKRLGLYLDPATFSMIDVGNLFKIAEPRTLSAAVKFYLGRDMENAHDAGADIAETVNVFFAQLRKYELPETVEELAIVTNYGNKVADIAGHFVYDKDGVLRVNFHKDHKGKPASQCVSFLAWMLQKDFPEDTKKICQRVIDEVSDNDNVLPF